MGGDRFDSATWTAHVTRSATKPAAAIFTSSSLPGDLDPAKFDVRESCDSSVNPNSTPICIFVDVTGSMGVLADAIVRKQLGVVVEEIYKRKPVTDPHVMLGAIGDNLSDRAPIQATQFEAGAEKLIDQTSRLYIEHNGGGNDHESYLNPLLLVARKTRCDSQIKRGRKGYLFTFGDENPDSVITVSQAKRFFNLDIQSDLKCAELLEMITPNWHYFHGVVADNTSRSLDALSHWRKLIGQRVLDIQDIDKLAEIIVSTIQLVEGDTVDSVVSSWADSGTGAIVRAAVSGLAVSKRADSDIVAV